MPDPSATGPYQPDPHDREPIAAGSVVAGKYKLLEAIGEGGMGEVWMAQQIEPVKRTVALKLIKSGMDSKTVVARFEAERQALSMMDHPNIARVLDVGATSSGQPFFVMELVKGTPITEFCDQRKLTPRQRLELFVPVCLAIQHAHQKGIIHRDIKPSNVLVALHDDKPVPKVIDFGVAKATGFTLTEKTLHTAFEQVVGTPLYMSPEQATFNQLDIDTRSDVYSLGVLLYELLTGTTPIERDRLKQAALMEILRVVREEEPPRPSTRLSSTVTKATIAAARGTEALRLTKELRAELDWVVMKSLEKDRTRRYSTVVNFAEDVQRYLSGEAVQAHPPSAGYRMMKLVRRYRGPVIAASLILLALIGGAVGTVYGMIRARGEREAITLQQLAEVARDGEKSQRAAAEEARGQAEMARDGERTARGVTEKALAGERAALIGEKLAKAEVAYLNYAHAVDLAYRDYLQGNTGRAHELLASCPNGLRGWEWNYVQRLCHSELAELKEQKASVVSASYSADGRRVVTCASNGTARIWDVETGNSLCLLKGHKAEVVSASFSADGRRVVTASEDKSARIWDTKTGQPLLELVGHSSGVVLASFSADGRQVATASSHDRSARVWDAEGGQLLFELVGHTKPVRSVSFSPDGRRLATAANDNTARVWNAESGQPLFALLGHTHWVRSISFSPNGRWIATASADKTARIWDAATGKPCIELKGHSGAVRSASFTVDSRRVATTSDDDNTARIWDAESGRPLCELKDHKNEVTSVAFSADGRRVVTASEDNTSRLWDAVTGQHLLTLKGHTASVTSASFSADGRRVLTVSKDGSARIWDADHTLPELAGSAWWASFSPDGRRMATLLSSADFTNICDAETGRLLSQLNGHKSAINSALFSADGRRVATASLDTTARIWIAETGQPILELKGHSGGVRTASFSADGRWVVTASDDKTARIWMAETGQLAIELSGHSGGVQSASFSADGRRVVTTSADTTARVWDAASGQPLLELKGHKAEVRSASFSRDGLRVGTASRDGVARIWDAETGKTLSELNLSTRSFVSASSFSADVRRVASASKEGIAIWDAETGKLMLTVPGHAGVNLLVAFNRDDSILHTLGSSHEDAKRGTIRIINYRTLPARESFRKYLEAPPPRGKP